MESLQHLSSESFSYSWLPNLKPSPDLSRSHSLDSFIEVDLGFLSSRWTSDHSNSFDFAFADSRATSLVHAEEIFANGLILPLHPSAEPVSEFSCSIFTRSLSLDSSKRFLDQEHSKCRPMFNTPKSSPYQDMKQKMVNCIKSPKKILQKYLFILVPLYNRMKGFRMKATKSTVISSRASVNAFSNIEWCCSADNRVYDAILHCKKSIGQQ